MRVSQNLHLAFDAGHSSIGWAVLRAAKGEAPELPGCGAMLLAHLGVATLRKCGLEVLRAPLCGVAPMEAQGE